MNQALADLKQRLAEIYDLERALGVLGWDQRTMMPPKGAAARAEASATLSGVIHERFISDEIGRLLDEVAPLETELGHDSDDASLVRVTRREWEKARRVPAEIAAAWAREGGKAHVAWLEAREQERLLDLPPGAPARARRRAAVGGADGAGRLAVRRVPRRVRAGDDDRRGEGGLRRAPARADRDRARRRRAGGRLVPRGRLSDLRRSRSSWPESCATSASRRARTGSIRRCTRSRPRSRGRTSG